MKEGRANASTHLAGRAARAASPLLAAGAVAACLGLPLPLHAQSATPPDSIFGIYRGEPLAPGLVGPDQVRVTRKGGDKVSLEVKLYFGHGHVCDLEETGRWTGSGVLVGRKG